MRCPSARGKHPGEPTAGPAPTDVERVCAHARSKSYKHMALRLPTRVQSSVRRGACPSNSTSTRLGSNQFAAGSWRFNVTSPAVARAFRSPSSGLFCPKSGGQPCNRLCKLCARGVTRYFATRGQLEFVCPWSLVPVRTLLGARSLPAPGEHGHHVPRGAEAVVHC